MSNEGMSIVATSNSGGFIAGMSGNCLAISCTSGWSLLNPARSTIAMYASRFAWYAAMYASIFALYTSIRQLFRSMQDRTASARRSKYCFQKVSYCGFMDRIVYRLSISFNPPRPDAGASEAKY